MADEVITSDNSDEIRVVDNTGRVDASANPFAPENIGIVQFIMLARIYDLLMVSLNESRPEVANRVLEAHRKGTILGTAPVLNGEFAANSASDTA